MAAVVAATAAAAAAFFPSPFVSGDMVFALIWGEQLLHGELSTFLPGPTPHPLAIAWGAIASLMGDGAGYRATQVVWGYLGLGAVVALAAAIAWSVWSPWAGVVTGLLLLLSPRIIGLALDTGYDLVFAALVLGAVLAEVHSRSRPLRVLALLAVAGLLRPEAWVLAGAYWVWRVSGWSPRHRVAATLLVALPPAVWATMDAVVTGDPLWSFHVTSSGSAVYRQHTAVENLVEGGRDLARYVGPLALAVAIAGLPLATRAGRDRLVPVLAPLAITLGGFAVLTVAGMASNPRYLLLPACLLAVVAGGVAAAGPGRSGRATAVAVAVGALLAVQVVARVDEPAAVRADMQRWVAWTEDAERLARQGPVAAVLEGCPRVAVPSVRVVPWFSYLSGRAPDRWSSDRLARTRPDAYLAPASDEVAAAYLTRRRFAGDATFTVPSRLRVLAETSAWRLYASPRSPCVRRAS